MSLVNITASHDYVVAGNLISLFRNLTLKKSNIFFQICHFAVHYTLLKYLYFLLL